MKYGNIHWKLYETARSLEELDATDKGESLLDPGASSLTFYEKGAWALYLLREEVGENAFRLGIKNFLTKYAFSNATVADFLQGLERASGKSLAAFRATWLESRVFPGDLAMGYLKQQSKPVADYLALLELQKAGAPVGEPRIAEAWKRHDSPEYKAHLLRCFRGVLSPSFLENACRGGSLPVQKAFLETTQTLQPWMIPMVETWLDAPSYDLREAALFRLWVESPENRARYLDRVLHNGSLSQMRMQQFWWLLAVITEGYGDPDSKRAYLDRLRQTTAASYSWETRENAFSMLQEVGGLSRDNLRDQGNGRLRPTLAALYGSLGHIPYPVRRQSPKPSTKLHFQSDRCCSSSPFARRHPPSPLS